MHLYTHIPFCLGKCGYCGFYSVGMKDGLSPEAAVRYLDTVAGEFEQVRAIFPEVRTAPETWYIGGGTPSLLGCDGFAYLADRFRPFFPLDGLREWSVELNPATVNPPLLATLRRIGVTRLSLGVQSFHDRTLRRIGRRHTAEEARRALTEMHRAGFDDIGLDLIAGLPDETEAMWRASLEEACRWRVKHLSVYALSIEPDTPFARERERGTLPPQDDERVLERLQIAETLLTGNGFERYEISNYALPGYACRHNLAVWRGEDYLGLGPAAASRIGNRRWTRQADLGAYLQAMADGGPPPDATTDTLSTSDDLMERTLFRLRLSEGLPLMRLKAAHPEAAPLFDRWNETLSGLARHGIVDPLPGGWRLTSRGREVCDAVLEALTPG